MTQCCTYQHCISRKIAAGRSLLCFKLPGPLSLRKESLAIESETYALRVACYPISCCRTSITHNSMSSEPQQPERDFAGQFAHALEWANTRASSISIHPGHVFFVGSLPFCLQAYRGYQKPLERVVQDVLKVQTGGNVRIDNLKQAEENIRRAVGSAVASRALRVATSGSVGVFGMAVAIVFYASGCSTVEQAMTSTRHWAHDGRKRLDRFFGINDRVDCDHPEYLITKNMTEEQEIEHVSKTYFPDEDWLEEPSNEGDQSK